MRDASLATGVEIDRRQKGVIHGQTFRFGAAAPSLDRLAPPLTLPHLAAPTLKALIERPEPVTLLQRLAGFLKKQRRETATERLLRRMREAAALIRTTLVPPAEPGKSSPASPGHGKFHRQHGLEHPYQLKTVLDLIPEIPDAYTTERKYLEELIFAVLRQYKAQVSSKHVWTFGFNSEAMQYFQMGDKIKRQINKMENKSDAKPLFQALQDNYFHGIYYYMMSVYIREHAEVANSLFLDFCNASLFLARLDWDGSLLEQPSIRRLPSRGQLLYFAFRDEWVLKQFNRDYDFSRRFKETLTEFPIGSVKQEAVASAPGRRGRAKIKHGALRGAPPEAAHAG